MDHDELASLLVRVRAGDEAATCILLKSFEDDVRKAVRGRLPRSLRTQFDSMDFVQSVWQSFFSSCDQDPQAFQNARHLRKYLAGVARNKVLEVHRQRTRTKKYDMNREERLDAHRGDLDVQREVPAAGPSPSQDAQAGDRLALLIAGRSPEEVRIIELRRQGLTLKEVAERIGKDERSVRRVIDAIRVRMSARASQCEPEHGSG